VQPSIIEIKAVTIRPVVGVTGARWIDVYFKAPESRNCLRWTQHLLYKNNHDADKLTPGDRLTRIYIPLGSALSGGTFPVSTGELEASMRLPYGIPLGEWQYVNRTAYVCTIWPGFTRVIEAETAPQTVIVPPIDMGDANKTP
jgi:hypothetical protein